MDLNTPIFTYLIVGVCALYISVNLYRFKELDKNKRVKLYILIGIFVLYVIAKVWRMSYE